MAEERVQRRLAAILAADVVGYSRLIEQDEEGTRARLRSLHAEVIDPRITADGGRIVKTSGDGILVEFGSAVDAVRNALAIQTAMLGRNDALAEDSRIVFRVGINVGDVIVEGDDIHGEGVNVAARLEGLCGPGEVYVSGTVYDQAAGKLAAAFDDLGEQTVKNIAKPVRVYRASAKSDEAKTTADMDAPLSLPDKPSIAVLPFQNMSGDIEQEYFADGMTEDLITDLSQVSGLFVIARNSSFVFKGQSVGVKEVGHKLGVKYVLEGSVRRAGDTVRINAQLLDAASGGHLWANRYDRKIEDIFALQDEITNQIVAALEVSLTSADEARAERRPSTSVEAHDLFLKGRASYFRYTPEDHAASKSYFEQAIEIDPEFADAYSFLSYWYTAAWNLMFPGFEDGLERALPMAEKAVSLDPDSAIAHMRLGWTLCFMRQFDSALSSFETAKTLGPDLAEVHAYYAMFLNYTGKGAEGLEMFTTAYRLEPIAPAVWDVMSGYSYWELHRYDEAAIRFRTVIDRLPGFLMTYMFLASVCVDLDRIDEAKDQVRALLAINSRWSLYNADRIFPILSDDKRRRFLENLREAGLPE
jgi:adenylate cyclase